MDIHKNTNNTIGGWYHYTSRDICEIPISVNIKGKLSTNASTPGLLHENADIAGHIVGKLDLVILIYQYFLDTSFDCVQRCCEDPA